MVKKNLSGNNFVDSNQLQRDLKLTSEQANQVQKAINNFNNLPTELKDGSSKTIKQIFKTTIFKQLEKDENTLLENTIVFVEKLGVVNINADSCYSSTIDYYWWGVWFDHSGCVAKDLAYNFQQWGNNASWAGGVCSSGVGGWLKNWYIAIIGGAICTIPSWAMTNWGNTIGYQNDRCGNEGVYIAMVGWINPWQYIYSKC